MRAEKFTLTITLGNAAMQTWWDIAHALHEVADKLQGDAPMANPQPVESGRIRDVNGNIVGEWRTEE